MKKWNKSSYHKRKCNNPHTFCVCVWVCMNLYINIKEQDWLRQSWKEQSGRTHFTKCRTYYKKIVKQCEIGTKTGKWNNKITWSPGTNSCIYGQLAVFKHNNETWSLLNIIHEINVRVFCRSKCERWNNKASRGKHKKTSNLMILR